MSDIQHYLLDIETNKAEAARFAANTTSRLEDRSLKIVTLIEDLGEYLNSEDALVRAKATTFLADVLVTLKKGVLGRQQRDLLIEFVLSRIGNGAEALGSCSRALLALESLGSWDQEKVVQVVNALFDNTTPLVQFKAQSDRFEVLRLFDMIMTKYREAMRNLHDIAPGFMARVIAYFDGEKDPRNLMIVFSVLKVPMVEWDVSADAQDLFDAVFNYFPITFRPPPNDPYGITAQDLKDRLRDCVASTGSFAPYSIPALLDKLDSTSANVKRDSLHTLTECVIRYGPATVNLYSITLWDAIKFEILNVQEEDLAEEALAVLYEIGRQLSTSPHEGPLQNYLKPICKECNEHLEDTPTKQSSASGRILGAVSKGSAEVSNFVSKAAVPQILQLFKSADSISRRRGLLEVLNELIKSNIVTFGPWRHTKTNPTSPNGKEPIVQNLRVALNGLEDYVVACIDVLMTTVSSTPISEVSYRSLALDGLQGLAMVRNLLDKEQISRIVGLLDEIIIHEQPYGKEEIKSKAIDALVQLARQHPQAVSEGAVPAFMAQLPDNDTETAVQPVPILEAFAKLSAEQQLFSTVIIRLKNKLYAALRQGASASYVSTILSAILYSFTNGGVDLKDPSIFGQFYTDIAVPFLKDIIALKSGMFPDSPALNDEATFDLIGRICNIIARDQPWVAQTELCRNVYTIFQESDVQQLPPFNINEKTRPRTMITSTHILASLQQEATPHSSIPSLLAALIAYAEEVARSPTLISTTVHQIALIVNKYIPANQSAMIVKPLLEGPPSLVSPSRLSTARLRVAFAILKALALRADPQLSSILPGFVGLLSTPEYGTTAARAFATLLAPDQFLIKANHCRVYAIHKQRLFSLLMPPLVEGYRATASLTSGPEVESVKTRYLMALSGLIQHVPYDIMRTELENLTPLIMQSLTIEDADVKAAAIATIAVVVTQDPKALEQHISSLVTRLLAVVSQPDLPVSSAGSAVKTASATASGPATSQKSVQSPPRIRAAALACLASFKGNIRDESLLPYHRQVVRRLAFALDDRRRAVRAEAVKCRAAWSGLAGIGDAEDDED